MVVWNINSSSPRSSTNIHKYIHMGLAYMIMLLISSKTLGPKHTMQKIISYVR